MARPEGSWLRIAPTSGGAALRVPVRYWSATGWHRFGSPVLEGSPDPAPPVDAVTLAALLGREAAHLVRNPRTADGGGDTGPAAGGAGPRGGAPATPGGAASGDPATPGGAASGDPAAPGGAPGGSGGDTGGRPAGGDARPGGDTAGREPGVTGAAAPARIPGAVEAAELVGRVAESVRRTAAFLAVRRAAPAEPGVPPSHFLAAEQSLVFGHPLHPTPKSREGLTDAEALRYSPESRGSFPLHWFAVDRSVLAADSAWTQRGRAVSAERLARSLAGAEPPGLPDAAVPLPVHPWQARELRHRPAVAELLDAGLLRDLGSHGPDWHPTSSLRTVHRPTAPAMLKLSLAVRITNSRRENLRKELHRGVEVHRLLRTGLHGQWQAACPGVPGVPGGGFDIVRDPAWLGVDAPDGSPVAGLDVVIRHNPFGPEDRALCVAGLTAPRPWPGRTALRSRLAQVVDRLAAVTGRPPRMVAAEWFLRYLHAVVWPVLWLDGTVGVALEAHQQNTVVLLDADGWPAGGRYRDNQGYYFRESRRAGLERRLPGIGERSDTFVRDAVADERLAYYLGVNNVLGLVGAFGSQRLADEGVLLAAFRRFLGQAASPATGAGSALPARLLDSPTLRCKANLLTRLHGLDELVGPVDTQSVYVTVPNPLTTAG
ncbi:IucA/IucC family protein [Streptomyces sp. NPDC018031]|uniref:IucA/IucC family protein n=1 Tax=Streptomyces sp. NPDC018031 TaxID=3365033 RepID=UPI003787B613